MVELMASHFVSLIVRQILGSIDTISGGRKGNVRCILKNSKYFPAQPRTVRTTVLDLSQSETSPTGWYLRVSFVMDERRRTGNNLERGQSSRTEMRKPTDCSISQGRTGTMLSMYLEPHA